ncbi:hypothetical protein BASA62_004482 [Batrachochytrium salamandrivorans]|nr:hypothetical protein BASA62_004482 [Batrachochytrium salamandrivorans]
MFRYEPRVASWRYKGDPRRLLKPPSFCSRRCSFIKAKCACRNKGTNHYSRSRAYDEIPDEIEDIINVLLNGVRDKDTIVRWTSAKSKITGVSDASWHGSCLALAELIRRGLLLPDRLKECIPWILRGLTFDQRKGKHSVGSHVRDAACYVCWSLARAYAPDVLAPYAMELAQSLVVVSRRLIARSTFVEQCCSFPGKCGRHGLLSSWNSIVGIAD